MGASRSRYWYSANATIVIVVFAVWIWAPNTSPISLKREGDTGAAESTVPGESDLVRRRLREALIPPYDSGPIPLVRFARLPERLRHFRLIPPGHELFPPADALGPPPTAKYDFVLLRDADYFWTADLSGATHHAVFGCSFGLQILAIPSGGTRLRLAAYGCQALEGTRFALGHSGPGFYNNYVDVKPSTQETQKILNALLVTIGMSKIATPSKCMSPEYRYRPPIEQRG